MFLILSRPPRLIGAAIILGIALCLVAAPSPLQAAARKKTAARGMGRDPYVGAVVLEASSGRVLFEDQADAKGYPASVLKLMDLLVILEKVEQRQLSFQDPVVASAKATRAAPSKVWLADNERFTLDEMLYALMVQSANDVAVALAEKVGGTTDGFVQLMNQRAQELGMSNTVFHSVNGLPPGRGQPHDVTTARDLSLLCREVLKHPDALRYTGTRQRAFRPNTPGKTVDMRNHNHLLEQVPGCDGLKTGWIAAAGYSIAVTAARNGQRVLVVVLGSDSLRRRDAKATELVNRGFALLAAAPAVRPPAPGAAGSPAAPAPKARSAK